MSRVTMLCPADKALCHAVRTAMVDVEVFEGRDDDERVAGTRLTRIEQSRCTACGAFYTTAIDKIGDVRPAGAR